MLRLSFLSLASLALLLSTGCAARQTVDPCTCVAQGSAQGYASSSAGWNGTATGQSGWNGSATGSGHSGWNGSATGTTASGWSGSGTQTAGWSGTQGAGWNGGQTVSWNGGAQAGGSASGRTEGSGQVGGPSFYGIPLGGAQDVVFVLDHSGSMGSNDASGGPVPASPLGALAVGMQAMATAQAQVTTGLSLAPQGFLGLGAAPVASLAPSKMQTAKAELIGALAALPDGTRFNVVFFSDAVSSQSQGLVVMSPSTRVQTLAYVQGINASGETAAVPAMRTAYTSTPTRVVFLSDGLANRGGTSQQLLAEARVQMRRGVRFDTVGVGPDQDAPLMQSLASESGGVVVRR